MQRGLAAGCQGGLALCRHEAQVWQALVVDIFLPGLRLPVHHADGPHSALVLSQLLLDTMASTLGWACSHDLCDRYHKVSDAPLIRSIVQQCMTMLHITARCTVASAVHCLHAVHEHS